MNKSKVEGICNELIFSTFFKSNAKLLRNYLFYKFGNEEQANDIAQEAFIKLWEKCSDVPHEKAKSFLYTVANNATLNQIKQYLSFLHISK